MAKPILGALVMILSTGAVGGLFFHSPQTAQTAPTTQTVTGQEPVKEQKTLTTKGMTLTEIRMPASFAPEQGADADFLPLGFSEDGRKIYAQCAWSWMTGNSRSSSIPKYFVWSVGKGLQSIPEDSAEWTAFQKAIKNRYTRYKKWEVANKSKLAADNPGMNVSYLIVSGMTLDSGVVSGMYILIPKNFKPSESSSNDDASTQEAKAKIGRHFIWRQDIGFIDFEKFMTSVPAKNGSGKQWDGVLSDCPIANDGASIACHAHSLDPDEYIKDSYILLVHSAVGFGKQPAQELPDKLKPQTP